MKTDAMEVMAAEQLEADVAELSDLQLALIGGGCGEIVVA